MHPVPPPGNGVGVGVLVGFGVLVGTGVGVAVGSSHAFPLQEPQLLLGVPLQYAL